MNELNKRRQASAKAVQLLYKMLQDIKGSQELYRAGAGRLACAFEWLRNNEGWNLQEVKAPQRIMPYACDFDGCRYGIKHRKPWRVITNCTTLRSTLKLRCNHAQPHGLLRGALCKKSEGYSKRLADAVFQGLGSPSAVRGHSVLKGDAARVRTTAAPAS